MSYVSTEHSREIDKKIAFIYSDALICRDLASSPVLVIVVGVEKYSLFWKASLTWYRTLSQESQSLDKKSKNPIWSALPHR